MTRLLRLELRRNTLLLLAPLVAVMFWFSLYRPGLSGSALWSMRSLTLPNAVQGVGPFMAGVAAWVSARDARRNTGDLVATTASSAWARRLTRWGATAGWGLLFYAAATGSQFLVTSRQATWGGPIWWPVLVGAAAVLAFSALGAAFGTYLPGRFVAPLVAIGAFLALAAGMVALSRHSAYGRLAPIVHGSGPESGVFYRPLPDLSLVQLVFLGGIVLVAIAVLGLPAGCARPPVRAVALALALLGAAATITGVGLAGTSREGTAGVTVARVHAAADDVPLTYQPVCDAGPIPICVHPAYRKMLPAVEAALAPLTAAVAGVPGAPVRIEQRPLSAAKISPVSGDPPVLPILLVNDSNAARFARNLREVTARGLVGGGRSPGQLAVSTGLAAAAGDPAPPDLPADVTAAARRFAALGPAGIHAWLATHLADLQAGRLTLKELP